MMDFSRMLEKIKQGIDHQQEAKDEFNKSP